MSRPRVLPAALALATGLVVPTGNKDDFLNGGAGTDDLSGGDGSDECINGETVRFCEGPL